MARNAQGVTARAGGWGHLIGDEGSAYALAVAALRTAARAADGVIPPTSLTGALVARLGVASPSDFVARVYGGAMSREALALLASTVFEEAQRDDVAARLVDEAAASLADLVSTIVTRLALVPGAYPLACAGSMLTRQDGFRLKVIDRLRRRGAEPGVVQVVTDPVAGALAIARRALPEDLP